MIKNALFFKHMRGFITSWKRFDEEGVSCVPTDMTITNLGEEIRDQINRPLLIPL